MARQPQHDGTEGAPAAGRARRGAPSLVVLVVFSLAFGITACGEAPTAGVVRVSSKTTTTTSGTAPLGPGYDEALAYSKCMRAHGVPNFPDPDAEGDIKMSSSKSGIDALSPQYQAAATACQKLEPKTGHTTSPPGAQLLPEWLKFSACMRAHGIVNFPDPKPIGNYGVVVTIPRSLGIDQNSPQFLAANNACQPLLKGNGPG